MSLAAWSVSNMTRRLVHENATKQVPIHPFSLPCKMEGYSQKVSDLNVVIWKVLKHEVQLFNCSFLQSNPMFKVYMSARKSVRLLYSVD